MVRICSVHSSESSESMSLLKVDGRKKQLTLCETSAAGLSAASRRSSATAPKTFLFDAIFSQDASQVRRDVLTRLTSPTQQHQTFIVFFVMFEYSDDLLNVMCLFIHVMTVNICIRCKCSEPNPSCEKWVSEAENTQT